MKAWVRKVWEWIPQFWGYLIGGLAVLIGILWWRNRSVELGQLRDEVALQKATEKVQELKLVRTDLANRYEVREEEIEIVDADIARNKRKAIEAFEHGKGLSNAEIAAAFARLGY